MKILHINSFDGTGGAAIAAMRLHQALLQKDMNSRFMTLLKTIDDDTVFRSSVLVNRQNFRLWSALDKLPLLQYPHIPRPYCLSPAGLSQAGRGIKKMIRRWNPDIVHLHWINSGMLSLHDIAWIAHRKPVVWTLHDLWAVTGGCHYPAGCRHYHQSCGCCPMLNSSDPHDLSAKILAKKKKRWPTQNITLVAPSLWMKDLSEESSLFKPKTTVHIPNGVPVDQALVSREDLCTRFNLPPNKRFILILAHSLADQRKGLTLFLDSLRHIPTAADYEILAIGGEAPESATSPHPIRHLGYLSSNRDLCSLYAAADVFVAPALEDNFPNTILESMSVGTPVVAFKSSGGAVDIIDHKTNGYLADAMDPKQLAQGITWILHHDTYPALRQAAAETIKTRYTLKHLSRHYIDLYRDILTLTPQQGRIAC